ncbi:hypothetical protein KUCAC02_024995, partial [Chaenocephalus aceratus]
VNIPISLLCTEEAVVEELLIAEEPIAEEPEVGPTQFRLRSKNPCLDHHCKKGKVCEVDEDNTPMCVCQDPSSCPASEGEYEHVCGTNNVTYESSCHFSPPPSALWREPRRATSCTWTTPDPANTSTPAWTQS